MDRIWALDRNIFRIIHHDMHREWLDPIFFGISSTGLGWVQVLFVLCLFFWKPVRVYIPPLLMACAFGLLSPLTKRLFPRERPSNLWFSVPQESFFYGSYPSGHTTTAFGIAFTLFLLTRKTERYWIGQLALIWAALVGISRIYRGVHWPTDVIGGMFLGLLGACLVYLICSKFGYWPKHEEEPTKEKVELVEEPS